jgi:ribokinase
MPQAQKGICVLGSSNIDLTFRTSRLPKPAETFTGQSFQLGFGGKGANQAVMAARLGARVRMVSKVGRDVFGEKTLQNFREQGIDTRFVLFDESETTGIAAIMVDDDARNCIIVVPGANGRLTPAEVRSASAALEGAALLLCQLEVPVETVQEAFHQARAAGVKTILNPAPPRRLPEELLKLTDYCIPNFGEMDFLNSELFHGQNIKTSEQLETAALGLLSQGPHTVIVTLGQKGCLIVEQQKKVHVSGIPVEAVDTTGAGDAFIGSLAVFLAEGRALEDAVRRANGVAALSVTRLGTQAAFPSRTEVEAFLAKQKWIE